MRAAYFVARASHLIRSSVSNEPGRTTFKVELRDEPISAAQCCPTCNSSRLLSGIGGILFVVLLSIAISGCTSLQTQENTLEQMSTIANLRYNQFLDNLSNVLIKVSISA